MHLARYNGPFRKTTRIETNDPKAPQIIVTLKGIVKHYVEIIPTADVRFGNVVVNTVKTLDRPIK